MRFCGAKWRPNRTTRVMKRSVVSRRSDVAAKADLLFALYVELGAQRSLDALRKRCGEVGVRIAISTLEEYSVKFSWQERRAAIEERARASTDERLAETVAEMNRRQARLGQAMQQAGALAVARINENEEIVDPTEAARLIEGGSRLQRLASGEATSRSEVINKTMRDIVMEIIALFIRVNELAERDDRTREFGAGADAIIERHVPMLEAEAKEG